jgi:hypothetical protein
VRIRVRPEWILTLPVVPILSTYEGWKVSISDDPDQEFTFSLRSFGSRIVRNKDDTFDLPHKIEVDACLVRDRFFAISTPDEALRFFQEFGPYFLAERLAQQAPPVRFSWLMKKRRLYEEALVNKKYWDRSAKESPDDPDAEEWSSYLRQPLQAEIMRSSGGHSQVLHISCKDIAACLRSTVFLDTLSGTERGRCARVGCPTPLFQRTRKTKKYCSRECEELQKKRNQRQPPKAQKNRS